jgi:hypothetical protein
VFNDGAWQRRVTPEAFCTIMRSKGIDRREALEQIGPDDLPGCYPFVTARHGGGQAHGAKLLYWLQDQGARGRVSEACSVAPAIVPECR